VDGEIVVAHRRQRTPEEKAALMVAAKFIERHHARGRRGQFFYLAVVTEITDSYSINTQILSRSRH
jgi:hypothetical protein